MKKRKPRRGVRGVGQAMLLSRAEKATMTCIFSVVVFLGLLWNSLVLFRLLLSLPGVAVQGLLWAVFEGPSILYNVFWLLFYSALGAGICGLVVLLGIVTLKLMQWCWTKVVFRVHFRRNNLILDTWLKERDTWKLHSTRNSDATQLDLLFSFRHSKPIGPFSCASIEMDCRS